MDEDLQLSPQSSAPPQEGGEPWDRGARERERGAGRGRAKGGKEQEKRATGKAESQRQRRAREGDRGLNEGCTWNYNKNKALSGRMRIADGGELALATPPARPVDGGTVSTR